MATRVRFGSRPLRLWNLIRPIWGDRPTDPAEIRERSSESLRVTFRLTLATVLGYLASTIFYPGNRDLTAGLTALLVVQATSVGTMRMGMVRVGAVLTGVLVAVAVASQTGLTWWSLALVVAVSLMIARLLRLHDQLAEAAISAMLILSGAHADVAATERINYTVIGAVVGMALTVLLPPALPITPARRTIREVADQTADLLDRISETMAMESLTRPQLNGWLARTRVLIEEVTEARETISEVKQSRILNVRALGVADVEPILGTGMDSLESALLSIRSMLTALLPQAPSSSDYGQVADEIDEDIRKIFAMVLSDTGECVRAFGILVEAEAAGRVEEAEHALGHSLEVLRETRAILTELMMVDIANNAAAWVLRGSTLGAVEQIMKDLDLEQRARVREKWLEDESRRIAIPGMLQGTLIHPEAPLPRGLHRELKRVNLRKPLPKALNPKAINPGLPARIERRARVRRRRP